jgi:hypothetical protein
MKILKPAAHQKDLTEKPSINLSISIIIQAFITRINKPSVKTVNGSVRKTIIGLIKVLMIAKRKATPTADRKFFILIPVSR